MRVNLAALSLLLALGIFTPVQARNDGSAEEAVKLSSEAAMVAAWDLARCSVKRDRTEARAILDLIRTDPGVPVDHRSLVQRIKGLVSNNSSCLAPGDSLTGKASVFLNVLAGAVFADKYKDAVLPDYSSTPALYTAKSVERAEPKERTEKLFRVFAECVFTLKSIDVQRFLDARPFSDDEAAALSELQPTMGICLPAQEGAQMKLSKGMLRGYLSMAAYLVDQVYEFTKPKQTSEMTREQGRLYA